MKNMKKTILMMCFLATSVFNVNGVESKKGNSVKSGMLKRDEGNKDQVNAIINPNGDKEIQQAIDLYEDQRLKFSNQETSYYSRALNNEELGGMKSDIKIRYDHYKYCKYSDNNPDKPKDREPNSGYNKLMTYQGGVPGIKLIGRETLAQTRDQFLQMGETPYLRGDEVVGRGWASKERKEEEEGVIRDILILFPGQTIDDVKNPREWFQLEEEHLKGSFIPWAGLKRLKPYKTAEELYGDPSDQNSLARRLDDWATRNNVMTADEREAKEREKRINRTWTNE